MGRSLCQLRRTLLCNTGAQLLFLVKSAFQLLILYLQIEYALTQLLDFAYVVWAVQERLFRWWNASVKSESCLVFDSLVRGLDNARDAGWKHLGAVLVLER